jgi:hypothetical protein
MKNASVRMQIGVSRRQRKDWLLDITNLNYKRGANLERAVKKYYEGLGFIAVRAAGSHGESDVWATNGKVLYFIQCKIGADTSRGAQILKEMEESINAGFSNITIPMVLLVVEGMTQGKPIILAESRLGNGNKSSNKKT